MVVEVTHAGCARWRFVLLANIGAVMGLKPRGVLFGDGRFNRSLYKATSVDSRGAMFPHRQGHGAISIEAGGVTPVDGSKNRREQEFPGSARQTVLLEMQVAQSASLRFILLCLLVTMTLVAFCAAAIHLVWTPLSAMYEERAFEQAAKQAFLAAAPLTAAAPSEETPPEDAAAVDDTAVAKQDSTAAKNAALAKQEKLDAAWRVFLESAVLGINRFNLLYLVLEKVFSVSNLRSQAEDLFDEALGSKPEGAPLTDIEHLSTDDLERVLDSISGTVRGMKIGGRRINTAQYDPYADVELAVATKEDYSWLFSGFEIVFTEQEPLKKNDFAGVICLVLAWNCVRTLHTARHMNDENRADTDPSSSGSPATSVQFKIDLRTGKSFEIKAEIDETAARAASFREEAPARNQAESEVAAPVESAEQADGDDAP